MADSLFCYKQAVLYSGGFLQNDVVGMTIAVQHNLEYIESFFSQAVSAKLPLDWDSISLKKAPAFLLDIAPAGAAKRFLMGRIGQDKPEGSLPESTMNHPAIALRNLEQRLRNWGLK